MSLQRVISLAGFALVAAPALLAPAVQVLVRLDSGEVELYNETAAAVSITYYELLSDSDSLLPGDWTPIAGRLDASGDGSFDGVGDWLVLSDGSDELSEGVFEGPGGEIAAGETVSLGTAWDLTGAADVEASFVIAQASVPAAVVYTPVGDYDWDGDVDVDDYAVFSDTFGSVTDLRADGNDDGVVNTADYTIWRDAVTPSVVSPIIAIPEPATAGTLLTALLIALPRRRPSAG